MIEYIQNNSGAFTFFATLVLIAVTAFYAWWTRGLLRITAAQSKLQYNPVIGIKVVSATIGKVFGQKRRNVSIKIDLTNVGNAPAIEVFIDSEIELRYSKINGYNKIPMRFEPSVIPFIKVDEVVSDLSLDYGNTFITHFFDDVRESNRLNRHRVETDPSKETFVTSRLYVFVYYRNSLGQYFKSRIEIELALWGNKRKNLIPLDNEFAEISLYNFVSPVFQAEPFEEIKMQSELSSRNIIRNLCGW